VLEDERPRDVGVTFEAAAVVRLAETREVRRAVRLVAVEARRRRGPRAMPLRQAERRAYVLVAPEAEIRGPSAEHRIADAAVAAVAVGARDPGERVLAAPEVVSRDVRRVAAQACRRPSRGGLVAHERAEPAHALPAARFGVCATGPVARFAAP